MCQDKGTRALASSAVSKLYDFDTALAVMGIVNVTPDSFSGDGIMGERQVLQRTEAVLRAGADWIDVGAESTRPGSNPVSLSEERSRLFPLLESVLKNFPEAHLSLDTTKEEIAIEALERGVHMINDVSGRVRPSLWRKLSGYGQARGWIVLMHRAQSKKDNDQARMWQPVCESDSEIDAVVEALSALAQQAQAYGVSKRKILLDPGIGFGKTVRQNLALLKNLRKITDLGYPVLVAASRKAFLARTLDAAPSDDRLASSLAACAAAIEGRARVLRVHDVESSVRFVRMLHAIRSAS